MSLPHDRNDPRAQRVDLGLPTLIAARVAATVPLNTRIAWSARWRRYTTWCAANQREPLPVTGELLTAFLEYLDGEGLKASSLDAHLSSISAVAGLWTRAHGEQQGAEPAAASGPTVVPALPDTTAARAYVIERKRHDGPRRAASALHPPEVRAMVDAMRPDSRSYLRDRALILLGFTLGRRCEHVLGIDLEDLVEGANGTGLAVLLPTVGDGRRTGRRERVEIPAAADPPYCPVAAVHAWQAALAERGYTGGPLFPRTDRHGRLGAEATGRARRRSYDDGRLHLQSAQMIIRACAVAAGLTTAGEDPARRKISTHSLRRGFVVSAFSRGADPVSVARHAGFADGSPKMAEYVEAGTGWERNPAAGLLDIRATARPIEPSPVRGTASAARRARPCPTCTQEALWDE